MFKQKDLQQQLVDAKLHQAQGLLKDSEDRHQKEKDFVSFYILNAPTANIQSAEVNETKRLALYIHLVCLYLWARAASH